MASLDSSFNISAKRSLKRKFSKIFCRSQSPSKFSKKDIIYAYGEAVQRVDGTSSSKRRRSGKKSSKLSRIFKCGKNRKIPAKAYHIPAYSMDIQNGRFCRPDSPDFIEGMCDDPICAFDFARYDIKIGTQDAPVPEVARVSRCRLEIPDYTQEIFSYPTDAPTFVTRARSTSLATISEVPEEPINARPSTFKPDVAAVLFDDDVNETMSISGDYCTDHQRSEPQAASSITKSYSDVAARDASPKICLRSDSSYSDAVTTDFGARRTLRKWSKRSDLCARKQVTKSYNDAATTDSDAPTLKSWLKKRDFSVRKHVTFNPYRECLLYRPIDCPRVVQREDSFFESANLAYSTAV